MLAGCATQNVDKEKDNQSTTSKKVYDSNNQKEQAISTSVPYTNLTLPKSDRI